MNEKIITIVRYGENKDRRDLLEFENGLELCKYFSENSQCEIIAILKFYIPIEEINSEELNKACRHLQLI